MTKADYITLGLVGLTIAGLLWTMRSAKERSKPVYDLHLRHGVDEFVITHLDEKGEWMVIGGGAALAGREIGDVVYIEQLTGPRWIGQVASVAVLNGHYGLRLERIGG